MKWLIALLIASGAAHAKTLTLREALAQGMAFSLEIDQAQSAQRASEAEYRSLRSLIFPTVDLVGALGNQQSTLAYGSSTSSGDHGTDVNRAYISISQPLYSGGAISSGLQEARLNQDVAQENLRSARQDYALNLVRAYLTASVYQSLFEMAQRNRDALKTYAEITRRYAKIGRSKNIDRLSSEANYSLSEAEVLDVENLLTQSFADLTRLMGVDSLDGVQLIRPKGPLPIEKRGLDQLLEVGLKQNPRIRSLELQIESLKHRIDVDLATYRPRLSLDGSYGFDSPERRRWIVERAETYSVFLNLTIPLFSGFGSFADRDRYREELRQLQTQLEIERRELYRSLAKALVSLNANFERVKLTRGSAEKADQATKLAQRDYRNGLISAQDVLQIQSTKYNADKQFMNAELNYLLQAATFNHALGVNLEESYKSN